jgi:2'-5' RNA ligase
MEGLHLTLRFLGPTAPERLAGVEDVVRRTAETGRPFRVALGGAGAFPTGRRPRVLWLDVVDGVDALASLTVDLDRGFHAAGWPLETRPFRPHLTLARTDGARDAASTAAALIDLGAGLEVRWKAETITLFESRTGGGPPRYEPLLVAPFGS